MKEYTLLIGGIPHTFLLTKEDALAQGAVEVKAKTPQNKMRTPSNKGGVSDGRVRHPK